MFGTALKEPQDRLVIHYSGMEISVLTRINPRAKKMILRLDRKSGEPVVIIPNGVREKDTLNFVTKHKDWLLRALQDSRHRILGDGDTMSFRGEPVNLQFLDTGPRSVLQIGHRIEVGGPASHAGQRLEKWLKAEALKDLGKACDRYAQSIGVDYRQIKIGDMKSRWGSCSSNGTLKFSWRLILLDPTILDYVCAHEVCHLREMNHSPAFWGWVKKCMPNYQEKRLALRQDGSDVMGIRFQGLGNSN